MASIREIKGRIKSIKETKQITKAMKLISAAKLKKARQQLDKTMPFFQSVERTMTDILLHSGDIDNIYFDERKVDKKKAGYLVLSGDKGLAGGYNSNIFKLTQQHIGQEKDSILLVAGHMGNGYFKRKKYNVMEDFDFPVQSPTVTRAREISEIILELFRNGTVDEFYIVFTFMVSSMKLEPRVIQLLPLELHELKRTLGLNPDVNPTVDETLRYEPSPKAVFDVLIPKYIKGIVYCTLVESFTSEQSARMTAMDSATNNAEDMLGRLSLFYNRARQAAITQEISEIVGGAAVLD